MTKTLSLLALCLVLLSSFRLRPAADGLSPEGKASKAAFERLPKLEGGVGEARIADLRMVGTPEYLGSPEGMDGLSALGRSFESHLELSAEAFRLYAETLPRIAWIRGWDGGGTARLARIARGRVEAALAERVRTESAGLLERTISKQEKESPKPVGKTAVDFFRLDLAHLRGNAMRGALMDRPAPKLGFLWCSEPGVKRLSDLKGKVVALDFWATWCKPCVGLFPKIREIAESYRGKPVVFVGVTSLQGFSTDPEAGRVSCKGDPQKEMGMMPGLMRKLGVTWTVAFSEEDCFNPDFDVDEIPHMAVVDSRGIVRYDGVEIGDLRARIDGLLASR